MEQIDIRFPLLGALVGALVGAFWHFRSHRPGSIGQPAREQASDPVQAQRVISFLERAARSMVAYSQMIDAANAGDAPALARLFRGLKEEEAAEQLTELEVDDRAVRKAAHAFLQLHAEINAKIEQRLADGQTVQIGGELRIRAADLGKRIETLERAARKYRRA